MYVPDKALSDPTVETCCWTRHQWYIVAFKALQKQNHNIQFVIQNYFVFIDS